MKSYTKILALFLFGSSVSVNAVESVPGVRGQGVKINGDVAYLYDAAAKSFDFKKGVSVSFWIKGNKWISILFSALSMWLHGPCRAGEPVRIMR